MEQKKEIQLKHYLALVLLAFIWGSSFILIKRSLLFMTPVQVASFRVAITSLAFMPYVVMVRAKINWADWYKYFLVGLTTTGIPSFCFAFAQKYVTSVTAGILNSLTPIFTLIVGVSLFHIKFQWSKMLGVMIGFLGAGLLIYSNSKNGVGESSLLGALVVITGTISYGFNTNFVKKYFPSTNPLLVSAGAFSLVGIPIILFLLSQGSTYVLLKDSAAHSALFFVTLLSLLCTLLANIIFFKLIQDTGPVFSSTVTFLIPVVAAIWAIWDGEHITIFHGIALICILIALWILRKR